MRFAFWLHEHATLSPDQHRLLELVLAAHHASVFRANISTQTAHVVACGSRDYTKALAAALLSTGGPHAPLEETHILLSQPVESLARAVLWHLSGGIRVPGWGNAFHKSGPDPLWAEVDSHICLSFPAMAAKLSAVTDHLHKAGKKLWPNPSAYTAATALLVGLPGELAAYLLVAGRLAGWSKIIAGATQAI